MEDLIYKYISHANKKMSGYLTHLSISMDTGFPRTRGPWALTFCLKTNWAIDQSSRSCTYPLFLPQRVEIELIISDMLGVFQNCHIWPWNLAIGQLECQLRIAHIYSLSTPGVEIELIFALQMFTFSKLPHLGMKLGNRGQNKRKNFSWNTFMLFSSFFFWIRKPTNRSGATVYNPIRTYHPLPAQVMQDNAACCRFMYQYNVGFAYEMRDSRITHGFPNPWILLVVVANWPDPC